MSKTKINKGNNDFATLYPKIAKEWHPTLNGDKSPSDFLPFSDYRAWWKCSVCGNEWQTRISHRAKGSKCKACIHNALKTAPYEKSLAALYPQIAKEWDFKNNVVTPDKIYPQSNKTYNWICDKRHRWSDTASHRTTRQTPCPICSGKKLVVGINDLATTHKELIKEWDYEKNNELGIEPTDVTYGSKKMVYWICPRGHSWRANIYSRTSGGHNCLKCKEELRTSFPEKAISYYLGLFFQDCLENYRSNGLGKYELDIYIPSLNVGIEYDGARWHKDFKNDLKKDSLCEKLGIYLIRIRENGCAFYDRKTFTQYIQKKDSKELSDAITSLFAFINKQFNLSLNADVNLDRDGVVILSNQLTIKKKKSICDTNLIDSWDWEKNKGVDPSMIPIFSNRIFNWKCPKCKYEWPASPAHRSKGRGCAQCAGQLANAKRRKHQ